jgi:hypothetical protein
LAAFLVGFAKSKDGGDAAVAVVVGEGEESENVVHFRVRLCRLAAQDSFPLRLLRMENFIKGGYGNATKKTEGRAGVTVMVLLMRVGMISSLACPHACEVG